MKTVAHLEAALRAQLARVREGRLSRRGFVARLAAWGVGASAAQLLLVQEGLAQALAIPPYKPTRRGGGGALKLLLWQGPTLLNPHFSVGAKDQEGCWLFYEPLMRYDVNGAPVPVLAAAIPSRANGGIAADGRSVTWKLKAGVTWHDGQPFTADDVVFNWQYATDVATAASTLGSYENVKAVEKVDALTVRVVFNRATALWGRGATVGQVPRHLFAPYKGAKSRENPANLKPVGTGPYRYADFKPADLVRGVLNPSYHQPNRPYFDSVEIKGGGDSASAARAVLQTGEFDFAWNIQLEDDVLKRMEASGTGRADFAPGGDTETIFVQFADPYTEVEGERAHVKSRNPLLGDPAVRKALSLLLDRVNIQQAVYGRAGVVTANVVNNPAPLNSPNHKHEFSIEKASALLDGAGWVRGGDGIRSKGGKRLKLVFQTTTNPVRQKVQQVFKQACTKAGIELELKAVTAAVFFSSDEGNPDTSSKFWADLEMFANAGRDPDPWSFLLYFASWEVASKANKWQGRNRGRWANAEFDKLMREAEVELDPVKRTAMFIRMNDIVCSDVAAIPLVYRPSVSALKRGLVASVSGWDMNLSSIADWYREA
jgi:peptide/nickel transport system substrate-binding protein